jgi:16S rRNA (cytidine1402-2'-O)-methyltransferase
MPQARISSAQRSSARAPAGFMAVLTNLARIRLTRLMPGTLYVVATPIGNLGDASERSLAALREADVVACEDTRVTRTLLARFGIETPMVALHEHNEREAARSLLDRLLSGASVALVSDAGTPGLSDPGAHLVAQAHAAAIRVTPIPGPSAVAAAISASGFPAPQFYFAGFLPATGAARRKALEALELGVPLVLYEAPHRIRKSIEDLVARFGPEREILLGRELSKKFEEVARMKLGDAVAWLERDTHREQGEYVLVLAAGEPKPAGSAIEAEGVLQVLLEALSPSEAARLAAKITGAPKNALYKQALAGARAPRK